MTVYHERTTATITFNPFLPGIGRVLEVLATMAPIGATIETTHRDLAAAAGLRSASQIPTMLKKLENRGYIERVATPRGSLIVVTDRSGMDDRSFAALGCDQGITDRSESVPAANPNETPDRSEEPTNDRSAMPDPPLHPPIRYKHESHEQQQPRAHASYDDNEVYQVLRDAGAAESVADVILARRPDLTVAEFEAMRRAAWRRAAHRTDDAIGLVFWCLQRGEKLYSPKDLSHERRDTRAEGAARHHRRHAGIGRTAEAGGGGSATGPVDYAALLAEIARDNPIVQMRLARRAAGGA